MAAITNSCLLLCKAERVAIVLFIHTPEESAHSLAKGANPNVATIDHLLNILVTGLMR